MSKLLLLCLIGVASAATFFGKPPKKPAHLAHKEGCYVKEVNDVIPYESDVTPLDQCVRIHCGEHMLDYATCGVIGVRGDPKCHYTGPFLGKPYPDCCPTVKCETDNDV